MAKIRKETKKSSIQVVDRFSLNCRPHKTKVITTAFQNNGKGTHEKKARKKANKEILRKQIKHRQTIEKKTKLANHT